MRLLHLSLTNFRNYTRLELSLPPGPILLHGANAQGKTSVLEAVYYLATSRSPWTVTDKQLLNWRVKDEFMPFARISAEVDNNRRPLTKIDITLVKDQPNADARFRKDIRVNGVTRTSDSRFKIQRFIYSITILNSTFIILNLFPIIAHAFTVLVN